MKKPFILLAHTILILACDLASPQPAIPPELTISLNPVTVSPYSDAILHVHTKNTGNTDWTNHSLAIGYAKVDGGLSMVSINQVPVNLPAGQSLDLDIPWKVDINDSVGNYELRMVLLNEKNYEVAGTKTAFVYSQPVISLVVNPPELTPTSPAVIHAEVDNRNGADMPAMRFDILASLQGEIGAIMLLEVPLTLKAGEVFTQDVPWQSDVPLPAGQYTLQAVLLTDPGSVQIQQVTVNVTVKE